MVRPRRSTSAPHGSYEEPPDDLIDDEDSDFEYGHSRPRSRKRRRDYSPPRNTQTTRSGRVSRRPPRNEDIEEPDRRHSRRSKRARAAVQYFHEEYSDDESDFESYPNERPRRHREISRSRRNRDRIRTRNSAHSDSESDDNSDMEEEEIDRGSMRDIEDESPKHKRRSPRVRAMQTQLSDVAPMDTPSQSLPPSSIKCRLKLKNTPKQEDVISELVKDADADEQSRDDEDKITERVPSEKATNEAQPKLSGDSDDSGDNVRRSRRARKSAKKLIVDEGDAEDDKEHAEEYKPSNSEPEDEDDGFEKDKLQPEGSDVEMEDDQDKSIVTRTRSKTRSSQGRKGLRSAPRNNRAEDSRYPRRNRREVRREIIYDPRPQRRRKGAADTYRPRRGNMRPGDFYESATSPSSSSSSDEGLPSAALTPSGGKDGKSTDFSKNPMALAEEMGMRRPRSSRYSRRRTRNVKAGLDPFGIQGRPGRPSKLPPIEPIKVDLNLSWDDVGGLDHHVRALKEMVFLPLVYPEVFDKFKIEPPKGVLFYGPPGTGKTLCARTLAASCGGTPDPQESSAEGSTGVVSNKPNGAPQTRPGKPANGEQSPGTLANIDKPSIEPNGITSEKSVEPDGFIVVRNSEGASAANGATTSMEIEPNGVVKDADVEKMKSSPVVQQAAALMAKQSGAGSSIPPKKTTNRRPRVAFFMRNGADCLSKWVGEAERQLRMTFEAAKRHQPAIIFFDEIDGLAPVRSSRQDQIHSSIVSTLLGLMDGLDRRGQIVVIGATNRVDAIDPALRRPGRFDRELIFTLPNGKARRRILDIQTKDWKPAPPATIVLDIIAERSVGYCGADLRALCTEAALRAVRRRYPQIYASSDKLLIDVDNVRVKTRDFLAAMQDIVPASHRSARTHARPIPAKLMSVLKQPIEECVDIIRRIFPHGISPEFKNPSNNIQKMQNGNTTNVNISELEDISDEDDSDVEVPERSVNAGREVFGQSRNSMLERPIHRPRLLVCGQPGLGQTHIGPALLHFLEGCPVHAIDLPSLHMNNSARTPEEALVSAVREACRAAPSILYLPHLQIWWQTAHEALRSTLIIALRDIPADLPVFLLATAEQCTGNLAVDLTQIFTESVDLRPFKNDRRRAMFEPLLNQINECPKTSNAALLQKRRRRLEPLPKAPPPPPKPVTEEDNLKQSYEDDKFIRTLRMQMRDFVENLLRDRKYKVFWEPVDPSVASDYYEIIKEPMDISKIAAQVDKGMYPTVFAMVRDFDLMVKNAIQYNPAHTEEGAAILRRAHGLVDIVHAWADNLNPLLVETCNKIVAKRIAKAAAEKEAAVQKANNEENAENKEAEAHIEEPAVAMNVDGVQPSVQDSEPKDPKPNGNVELPPLELEEELEPMVRVKPEEVEVLLHLVGTVTDGVAVDGLERLHAKLSGVLYASRRCRNRSEVLAKVRKLLLAARDDPAVVGNLVE